MSDTPTIYDMREAIRQAEEIQRRANVIARDAATLVVGRLRHCNAGDLALLKRELRNFNLKTYRWKK